MNPPNISLNVDFICDMARASGADDATLQTLRARLEAHNGTNNPAFDLAAAKIAKTMEHLSKDWILSDGINEGVAPPAEMLRRAAELQSRILLGQWKYVAQEIETLRHLAEKAGSLMRDLTSAGARQWQTQMEDLSEVATWLEERGNRNGGVSLALHGSSYQGLSAACVLQCERADCGLRRCCETRCHFTGDDG